MRWRTFVVTSGLSLAVSVGAGPLQVPAQGTQAADPERQAVFLLRTLGTVQAGQPAGPFKLLSEVLQAPMFKTSFPAASLSDGATAVVGDRTLVLTVSEDRKHFLAMVAPVEKCGVASFTNESGVIYTAHALGCGR